MYLCAGSLGCQPKGAKDEINKDLENWAKVGINGQLQGEMAWIKAEDSISDQMAEIVGAIPPWKANEESFFFCNSRLELM